MSAIPTTQLPNAVIGGLAADGRGLDAIKSKAGQDPKGAIRQAAVQFESLFMQELMKGMRQSTMPGGLTDGGEGGKLATDLLDTQFATKMSGQPGGLADIIARQLERQMGVPAGTDVSKGTAAAAALRSGTTATTAQAQGALGKASDFVARNQDAAREVEKQTGIPAGFLIAQAAHETGWGKKEIKNADGSSANNLFGIKAGANWKGAVAEVTTTEYVNGQPTKVKAKFRAYASVEESFADYAKLMKDNPRYERVLANAGTAQGFAQGLQKAGYATDPAYADKLTRVINTTLRLQRTLTA
ncbi:flagellar assembly peptidoglycan hydrolase FlgJ [Aquabacterium sp. J223]|uniref:flagellar assembly peptidoglycan hydrolase FlgJ n=1 Tax=Aquabacterium sp. J223 TaxID=2898431 RepID=UPI0021AD911E|nr:flagellar assembly peptidoglycan hydrolase FlgJ [Aquabacterium sp. J223]UUX97560.1 flagellar assembly peptidoglycan hydrolase FlgJ [Aquabacterium sp. J223]